MRTHSPPIQGTRAPWTPANSAPIRAGATAAVGPTPHRSVLPPAGHQIRPPRDVGPALAKPGSGLVTLPSSITGGDGTVLTMDNLIKHRANPGRTTTVLLPYGRAKVNLDRTPVILIHGMFGNLEHFGAIAEQADRQGKQVYVFKYDTGATLPRESAEEVREKIQALSRLYEQHGHALQFDLVTHSMGGPVARLALESLSSEEVASVRWIAVDAPWGGRMPKWYDFGAGIFGGDTLVINALKPDSALYTEHLYRRNMEGVTYVSVASTDDFVPSIANLSSTELEALFSAMLSDGPNSSPGQATIRNILRNLESDARYPALREWVAHNGDSTDPKAFRDYLLESGFALDGGHNSVLRSRRLLTDVIPQWLSPTHREADADEILRVTDPMGEST